jgi:hypothetical protein
MEQRPQQLGLFHRNQRGAKPPPAPEFRLHCLIADLLTRWCNLGWRWTHLPFGEWRSQATAARLKRMGTQPGWPDFIFVHEDGQVCWLELKRRDGKLSRAQYHIMLHLTGAGHDYLVTGKFDEALAWLKNLGIVRSGIQPQ